MSRHYWECRRKRSQKRNKVKRLFELLVRLFFFPIFLVDETGSFMRIYRQESQLKACKRELEYVWQRNIDLKKKLIVVMETNKELREM